MLCLFLCLLKKLLAIFTEIKSGGCNTQGESFILYICVQTHILRREREKETDRQRDGFVPGLRVIEVNET